MQNPVLRTFLTNLSSCSKSLCGLKKESSEGPWINARDDTDPITSDAGQFKGGGSAAAYGDYVGLGCCELDHIAQSNGPLRKGGKAKGWRLRNALFSALLWRPSIRPRTFPFSLPLLAPPPLPPSYRIYSSFLLPGLPSNLCQPPLNPSVLYIARPSQSFSRVFFPPPHRLISSLRAAHPFFHIIFLRHRHRCWPFTPYATPQTQLPRSLPHPLSFISFITTLLHCCTPPRRLALPRWLILTFFRQGGEWR